MAVQADEDLAEPLRAMDQTKAPARAEQEGRRGAELFERAAALAARRGARVLRRDGAALRREIGGIGRGQIERAAPKQRPHRADIAADDLAARLERVGREIGARGRGGLAPQFQPRHVQFFAFFQQQQRQDARAAAEIDAALRAPRRDEVGQQHAVGPERKAALPREKRPARPELAKIVHRILSLRK